jgi:hypothetical protein
MWVHLKASISFEAESHDATQICRAAAEIVHGQTPFQYYLTARFRDAAPDRKKEIENLERKAWQNSANLRCDTCCSACRWHLDWPQIRQLGAGLTAHWLTERQGRPVGLEHLLLPERPRKCVEGHLAIVTLRGKFQRLFLATARDPKNTHAFPMSCSFLHFEETTTVLQRGHFEF